MQGTLTSRRRRQECLYLRYFRVGKVNLDVTTSGFSFSLLNVNNFRLTMEAFVHRTTLTSWRDLIWILEKHILVSFTTSLTSHTVRSIWPWNKGHHNPANSKASLSSLASSSAPSSPLLLKSAGTSNSNGLQEDDHEAQEAMQKLGALLGYNKHHDLLVASSNFSDSSSSAAGSPTKRSSRGGLLSELRKKFALLRKK